MIPPPTATSEPIVQPAPTAEPTPTPSPTPTPTPTPTPAPPIVGTTVEAGGNSCTVNVVRDPAPPAFGVVSGKRLVAIDVTQVCIAAGDSYNEWNFGIQDTEGYIYDTGDAFTDIEPSLSAGELVAGQRVRGWVSFQVPEAAVLVAVLVEAEIFGPKIVIADLTAAP